MELMPCPTCGETPTITRTGGSPPRLSKSGRIYGCMSPKSVIECCGVKLTSNHLITGIDGLPKAVEDPESEVVDMWNQYARSGSLFASRKLEMDLKRKPSTTQDDND